MARVPEDVNEMSEKQEAQFVAGLIEEGHLEVMEKGKKMWLKALTPEGKAWLALIRAKGD